MAKIIQVIPYQDYGYLFIVQFGSDMFKKKITTKFLPFSIIGNTATKDIDFRKTSEIIRKTDGHRTNFYNDGDIQDALDTAIAFERAKEEEARRAERQRQEDIKNNNSPESRQEIDNLFTNWYKRIEDENQKENK